MIPNQSTYDYIAIPSRILRIAQSGSVGVVPPGLGGEGTDIVLPCYDMLADYMGGPACT